MQDPVVMADLTGRTREALNLLLANSETMQQTEHARELAKRQRLAFLKEYCTVKVGGPRRSGHSTCAKELIRRFGKENVIVVVPRIDMWASDRLPNLTSPRNILTRVRGVCAQAVVVDVAGVITGAEMDGIYRACGPCLAGADPCFFILLE